MLKRAVGLLVLLSVSSACYHARVETGLQPSAQTLERSWAHGWIFGLVPPSTVDTMERCPNGVARVDTQLSFANQLVAFLTSYIYTPMSIVVTCAAASEEQEGEAELQLVTNEEDATSAMRRGESFLIKLR